MYRAVPVHYLVTIKDSDLPLELLVDPMNEGQDTN